MMYDYENYEKWLLMITQEIERKYKIKKPSFKFNDDFGSREESIGFIDYALGPIDTKWVKYCYLKDDLFELKVFMPDPPLEVCQKIVDDFFKNFYEKIYSPYFKKEVARFTIFGDCTYTEKEMRQELLYLARTGNAKFEVKDGQFMDKGTLVYFLSGTQDSLANMLQNGYLTLEYFND